MANASTSEPHLVDYDANKSPVGSVTVFQTDRAEVKRKIKVELKGGQNDVEVKNLPTCLEESSIRVDGIGNATIFDVVYHPPPALDHNKHAKALQQFDTRRQKLTADIAILNRQAEILKEYSNTLTGKDVDSTQLEIFLDVYASRQSKINAAITKLEDELKLVQKGVAEKSVSLDVDDESLRQRGVRVTIVVHADSETEAELFLTYIVSNAWWTPQYDLRATIAQDTKSESQVGLHYRASIVQKTGEDWAGVALTLSTASPLRGTSIPTLAPYWISVRSKSMNVLIQRQAGPGSLSAKDLPPLPSPGGPPGDDLLPLHVPLISPTTGRIILPPPREMDGYSPQSQFTPTSPQWQFTPTSTRYSPVTPAVEAWRRAVTDDRGAPPLDFFHVQDSETTGAAASTTFTIPGLSSISSDSDKEQQTHKVSIAELKFCSVDLEWITVPKDVLSVFLRCKVKNTTKFFLLSGKANIFLNGSFVAKSSIPHVSPQESFSCSLGVDPAVRVTYHPQTKKTKTTGGSVLTTEMTATTFEQAITLKNTRLSRLPRLLVKDHIPVSNDAQIKVALLEPKSLSSVKGKATAAGEGIQARWVQRSEEDSGVSKVATEELTAETAQGMIEWVCTLEPGATAEVNLSWEISAPSGVD